MTLADVLKRSTLDVWVTDEARVTRADGSVSVRRTVGVDSAGVGVFAGIPTNAVITRLVGRAVIVVTTALHAVPGLADVAEAALEVCATTEQLMGVFALTDGECVATELWRTAADGSVILRLTQRVATAGAEHRARVLTALVNAGHGVAARVVRTTRVDAFAVFAYLSRPAVAVLKAHRDDDWCALNGRVTSEAGRTRTAGSVTNCRALGVHST